MDTGRPLRATPAEMVAGGFVLVGCAAPYLPLGIKYVAFLGAAVAALVALRQRFGDVALQPAWAAALPFAAWMWLSAAWSPGSGAQRAIAGWYVSLPLFVPLIAAACPADLARRGLRMLAVLSAGVGLALLAMQAAQWPAFPGSAQTLDAEGNQRIALSLWLALGSALAVTEAIARAPRAPWQRVAWALVAASAALGLAAQDRRSGMLALPVLWMLIVLSVLPTWRRRVAALVVIVALTGAAFALSSGVQARFAEGLNELRNVPPPELVATSWGQRWHMLLITAGMVQDAPVVGHGLGSWPVLWQQRTPAGSALSVHSTPHNEYLLVASQAGAVGLVLWLVLLGLPLRQAWRAGEAGRPALLIWGLMAWAGCFNAVLRDAKFALPLLLLAAAAAAAQRQQPTSALSHA